MDVREYDTSILRFYPQRAPCISYGTTLFSNIPMTRWIHKYQMQFQKKSLVSF